MLSWLIVLPAVGAGVVALLPGRATGLVRWVGLLAALATLGVAVRLWALFDPSQAAMQFVERRTWAPGLGIAYHVGVDGISLLLVGLTALTFPVALLASWSSVTEQVKGFTVAMLLLETAVLGTFLALDLVLFFVFWEAVLVPMYFLIGLWGGPARTYAANKFLLYTMAGSAFMLVAIVALYILAPAGERTFDLLTLQAAGVGGPAGRWLFWAFTGAFAVKVPVWPLHTWLPDAHVEAPTPGSVVLAALLLKMGAYGLVRFSLGLFPEAAAAFAPVMALLGIVGIVYGGIVSWAQADLKRLVAYSSVSHLGFVTLGIFAMNPEGLQGAVLQMVNHGISTGALFLIVGVLYDRLHTRQLADYGGVAARMPRFAAICTIVMLSSAALPGTNGFVGEFLILLGAVRRTLLGTVVAASGVVLSAVYLLWAYQQVMQGPLRARHPERLTEVGAREALVFAPLVALIFAIGLAPGPVLRRSEASVRAVVARVEAAGDRARAVQSAEGGGVVSRVSAGGRVAAGMAGTTGCGVAAASDTGYRPQGTPAGPRAAAQGCPRRPLVDHRAPARSDAVRPGWRPVGPDRWEAG